MTIYPLAKPAPLSEEEKKNPYSHLYDLPIAEPSPELIEALTPGNMMDSSNALPITELEKLFIPNTLKQDNGYCMLPDGTCYSVVRVKMPQVTEEMEHIWNDTHWTSQDDVHYKVWFPGMHHSHKMPVIENLGWGVGAIHFGSPLILDELLSAPPQELDPNFVAFSGCSGYFVPQDNPDEIWYNTIANCVRKCPDGGLECQTINWCGIHLIHGEPVRKIPEGTNDNLEHCRLFGCHNAWENTRKNQVLPLAFEIWKTLN